MEVQEATLLLFDEYLSNFIGNSRAFLSQVFSLFYAFIFILKIVFEVGM